MSVTKENLNVLVVDNNPVLLKALTALLVKEGCAVKTAENGLDALDVLRDWDVDIVFTDLVMPLVEGDVLCKIIKSKEKYKHIFVAIISAIVTEDRERILEDVPCDLCFAKGSIVEMRQQVQEALELFRTGNLTERGDTQASSTDSSLSFKQLDVQTQHTNTITKELLLEKDHLRHILEDLSEGILELNNSGKIVRANSAIAHIFNKSQEDMIGMLLSDVISWDQYKLYIDKWLKNDLLNGEKGLFEIKEDDPLSIGDLKVTAKLTVVCNEGGCFGICIFHDITRQYLAEKHKQEVDAAMEMMKKMEAMRGMAGGVAHDFNNLLTVICGNLDIILASKQLNISSDERSLIESAKRASLVAVDLTRTISCFSNFGIVHRVDYELGGLIKKGLLKYLNTVQFPYDLKLTEEKMRVQVDPSEIELAIENILENSLEALDGDEQTITIMSEEVSWTEPQLLAGQYIPAGKYARVDIADKGPGIKSQFLSQVFDAYYSTKERSSVKGMGLGLAVVYSVMRNHGGYAVVDSVYGEGTTVSLFFPVYQSEADENNGDKADVKTILLIESDTQLRELGRIMLEYLGYNIVVVESANSAINYLEDGVANKNISDLPAVVLFEVSELAEDAVESYCMKIQKLIPSVDIIGISGTTLTPVMENCTQYGISNTLAKPYTLDSLKHVLQTAEVV